MMRFMLEVSNGDQRILTNRSGDYVHQVSFQAIGQSPSGIITLTARSPGTSEFLDLPDDLGTFDLSDLEFIRFEGAVAEYNVNISGISDTTNLYMNDDSWSLGR